MPKPSGYVIQPRGKPLFEDESSFGSRMLAKMGWSKGKGLGANEDGKQEFIRVRYKNDIGGFGYQARDDQWTENEEGFKALLENLNQQSGDSEKAVASLEQMSKGSKARVHYQKFTRGKDLSRYSAKDLANIFGKKSLEENNSPPAEVEKNDDKAEVGGFAEDLGTKIINTGVSIADYFKSKKNGKVESPKSEDAESLPQESTTKRTKDEKEEEIRNSGFEEPKKKKKKTKAISSEESPPETQEEPQEISKKSKKQKRKEEILEESPPLEPQEDPEAPRKNKKNKRKTEESPQETQEESQGTSKKSKKSKQKEENEQKLDEEVPEENPKKKKKKKKETVDLTSDSSEDQPPEAPQKASRRKTSIEGDGPAIDLDSGAEEEKSPLEVEVKTETSMVVGEHPNAFFLNALGVEKLKNLHLEKFRNANIANVVGYGLEKDLKLEVRDSSIVKGMAITNKYTIYAKVDKNHFKKFHNQFLLRKKRNVFKL